MLTLYAALALFQNRCLFALSASTGCLPVQLVPFDIERTDLGHTTPTEKRF